MAWGVMSRRIEIFRKDAGRDIIYRHLTDEELTSIRSTLANKILGHDNNYEKNFDFFMEIVSKLAPKQRSVPGNADDPEFSLVQMLNDHGVVPHSEVLIDWWNFDDIDELPLDEMPDFFKYLWFRTADYIDIFDRSFAWVFTIDYDGYFKLAAL